MQKYSYAVLGEKLCDAQDSAWPCIIMQKTHCPDAYTEEPFAYILLKNMRKNILTAITQYFTQEAADPDRIRGAQT